MVKIKCSNCGFEKNVYDLICPNCYYSSIKSNDIVKILNKMYANRLYGRIGIENNNILYTDTDSIFYHGGIIHNCSSYWEFKGIKFPCQLKSGHKGMHINNPLEEEHIATILW